MRPLVLSITSVLVAAFTGCADLIPKKAGDDKELPPQVSLRDVRVLSWDADQLVATGRMKTLTYDRSSAHFEGSDVVFLFPSERREGSELSDLELRAPRATGNLTSKQADGFGGVLLRSSSGLRAVSDRAHLDGVGMVASGDTRVDAKGPGFDVTADGFRYDFTTEDLVFEGHVQSRLGGAGGMNE